MCDNLESVPLVNKELLAFCRVEHLLGVLWHKGIKEGIEALIITSLCTKNSPCRHLNLRDAQLKKKRRTKTLCFLTTRTKVRWNLNKTRCLRQIDWRIPNLFSHKKWESRSKTRQQAHLRKENGVNVRMMLKVLQNTHAFNLRGCAMDIQLPKLFRIVLHRLIQSTWQNSKILLRTSNAYTLSEKTMILSPRSSWYLIKNWHAWSLFGFMQYSNVRLRVCSRRYSR